MAQHSTRTGWVQRGTARVKHVAAELPHLWEAPAEDEADAEAAEPSPSHGTPHHPIMFDSALVEAECAARIAAIGAEAEARVAAAGAEAERWRQHALQSEAEGYSRGFAAGYNDGLRGGQSDAEAAVRAELRGQIDGIAALARSARVDLRGALVATREQLTQLSSEIARAVIGEALRLDHALLSRRVAHLLDTLGESTTAIVRVAPEDLARLQPHWTAASRARRNGERGPRVVADETLTPGDCIIEGTVRYLDARVEPLLTRVAATFAALPADPPAGEEE